MAQVLRSRRLARHHDWMSAYVQIRDGSFGFLRTELNTGLTFAEIALRSRNEDKINRNRENARKALHTARHFMKRVVLSSTHAAEIHEKLEQLEGDLRVLDGSS